MLMTNPNQWGKDQSFGAVLLIITVLIVNVSCLSSGVNVLAKTPSLRGYNRDRVSLDGRGDCYSDPHEEYNLDLNIPVSRRGAVALATIFPNLLLWPKRVPASTIIYPNDKKAIVITGCNSGIGFDAASRMANRGHKVIMACRTLEKARNAAERIKSESNTESSLDLVPAECDLASLSSIRSFAGSLGDEKIDILCLNAGIARDVKATDVLRTKEGFELTGKFPYCAPLS